VRCGGHYTAATGSLRSFGAVDMGTGQGILRDQGKVRCEA